MRAASPVACFKGDSISAGSLRTHASTPAGPWQSVSSGLYYSYGILSSDGDALDV